ncbi:MAG: NAD-dependent DNA ligase [Barrevirus sp.]|uniref:DNA ligase (NAD(+)) n=1 Tax=Barrevirus sp. TaxID=2487763 RepID=A0A3G4ZUC8_9VIRU|nr:MAG: NAD-dependent DNA ligase [Barrevirus sp.]
MFSHDKINSLKKHLPDLLADPYQFAKYDITVDDLVTLLKELSHYYYNTSESLVPDAVYDLLRDVLEERDPQNKYLEMVGALPISKSKVDLPYPMASLNKIKPDTKVLETWLSQYKGPFVVSDKLDGVSGLLHKKNGKFKLYTRGDSTSGQDITHLIPYLLNGKFQPGKIPDGSAIRGEIIMSKKNFDKIKDNYKNARNTVAGLVNSKNFSVDLAKITDFVGYAVINPKLKQEEQMKKLEEWAFPTVTYKVLKVLTYDVLSKMIQDRRANSPYEVDGLVVQDSSKVYDTTIANPASGFAFKMVLLDQVATVTVKDIEWSVTRLGYIKPVVKIVPTKLVGVTISNVTAHNAKYVVDNKLGPGSVIKIVRSGDVIPYILEVLKPSTSGKPKLPTIAYKWNKSGIDLIVQDIHGQANDTIIIKQITHFFKVLGVKYISEGIVTKLVDNGYTTIKDIIVAKPDDLAEIEGIGDKLVKKVYDNMRTAFDVSDLSTLMAASGVFGRGLGTRKLQLITSSYPNIMNEKWTSKELIDKVLEIDGFDTVLATQFSQEFPKFVKFFDELSKINTINIAQLKKPVKPVKKTGNLFQDKKVVFTGFRNKEFEDFIVNNGGSVTTSVSKNTSLVIYSDPSSSKYTKAIELSIDVMTPEEFKKKYKL